MVCDFSEIKRVIKSWVDRELDHKMILRHDDPLVQPLRELGEPVYVSDSKPDCRTHCTPDLRLRDRPRIPRGAGNGLGDSPRRPLPTGRLPTILLRHRQVEEYSPATAAPSPNLHNTVGEIEVAGAGRRVMLELSTARGR